jgi:hypothetical protein
MKTTITLMLVLATLGLTPIAAQETPKAQPDFVLVNNTGEEISSILIIPSAKKYKENKNACAIQRISLADTGALAVNLPDTMRRLESFDLEITYGKRYAKTKQSVSLAKGEVYILDIEGKGTGSIDETAAKEASLLLLSDFQENCISDLVVCSPLSFLLTKYEWYELLLVPVCAPLYSEIAAIWKRLTTGTLLVTKLVHDQI